jgi:CMP-N-acetylneuraminic acid synthetase
MFNDKKILAIIPARGGSKRLPRKNIMDLNGKPLIVWTIEAAQKSLFVDEVIVTTDCNEIAEVAVEAGATVPFLRPDYLSSDEATTNDVIMHAVENYKAGTFDYYIILQPTSPMRTTKDIDDSIKLISEPKIEGVVSVCPCEHSPLWCNTLPETNSLGSFLSDEVKGLRSQDLPTYYRLNGAIYCYGNESLVTHQGIFYSDNVKALVMPTERSVDIDNLTDFKVAEVLLESLAESEQ